MEVVRRCRRAGKAIIVIRPVFRLEKGIGRRDVGDRLPTQLLDQSIRCVP